MLYYKDRGYSILQKDNQLYDIIDAKHNTIFRDNQTKEEVDDFIKMRQDRIPVSSHSGPPRRETFAGPNIILWQSCNKKNASLIAKLYHMEDFSGYAYPWLSKVVQLALEYLVLKDIPGLPRASQIPLEILDICQKAVSKTE